MAALFSRRLAPSLFRQMSFPMVQSLRGHRQLEERITMSRRLDSFEIESDAVKDKAKFLEMIENFKIGNPNRRGHVEFILVALNHLHEFQVEKDLEVYRELFELFPKKKMIPQNILQAEFDHFPRHQDTALDILMAMNLNYVIPDRSFRDVVLEVFGPETTVFKKFCRMMYWMPKMKNASPYRVPFVLPTDPKELALIGIRNMTNVEPSMVVEEFDATHIAESIDKTWIISAQSPTQQRMLLQEKGNMPLRIEGPFLHWIKNRIINYYTLLGDRRIKPKVEVDVEDVSDLRLTMFGQPEVPSRDLTKLPNVHEQAGETIFACCATGTSSRDSLIIVA